MRTIGAWIAKALEKRNGRGRAGTHSRRSGRSSQPLPALRMATPLLIRSTRNGNSSKTKTHEVEDLTGRNLPNYARMPEGNQTVADDHPKNSGCTRRSVNRRYG